MICKHTMRRFWLAIALCAAWSLPVKGQDSAPVPAESPSDPLAAKQEMIRDRFRRFEDRVFRLHEQLAEIEPANARRLARVLERVGELRLSDRLNEMIRLLEEAGTRGGAVGEHREWLADIERVLDILLERDSDDPQRQEKIDRLRAYRENLDEIIRRQETLRGASAEATMEQRLAKQIEQALQRLEAMSQDQSELLEEGGSDPEDVARQRDLGRAARELADELKRLAGEAPSEPEDETPLSAARREIAEAAGEIEQSAEAMGQAKTSLEQSDASARPAQEDAVERLQRAEEQLRKALQELTEQPAPEALAGEQNEVSEETQRLAEHMDKDRAQPDGAVPPPSSDPRRSSGTPGQKDLRDSRRHMEDAEQSLRQDDPAEAVPSQDEALEELEQARKELEEALNQFRKEERAETLRDIEARFREMIARQRVINEATAALDVLGVASFTRAEALQLGDLSVKQRDLSDQAATSLHILEEDATTVVFPSIVQQVREDMNSVADRLAGQNVGALTQRLQGQIIETLEQILDAVQQMQRENEREGGGRQGGGSDEPARLLPTSAELKLLRSSQVRINERTKAVDEARSDASESAAALQEASASTAQRQQELAAIARELRDRQEGR